MPSGKEVRDTIVNKLGTLYVGYEDARCMGLLSEFDQSKRAEGVIAPNQVDEGYCQGVCIDWARRVLLGNTKAFGSTHHDEQALRQATIQLNISNKSLLATTSEGRRSALLSEMISLYNSNLSNDKVTIPTSMTTAFREFATFTVNGNGVYMMSTLLSWINLLKKPKDSTRIHNAAVELSWDDFARLMDVYFDQKRLESSRTTSKRRFSGIELVDRIDRKDFANIPTAMNTILTHRDFKAGCAMVFGFAITVNGSQSGHAIALYRDNVGNYLFMEPNYGIFHLNQRGCTAAITYIFGTVYQGNPGWSVVGTNGSCKMRYTLLRAKTPVTIPVITLPEPLKPIAPKSDVVTNPTATPSTGVTKKFTPTPHTMGGQKTGGVSTPHSGTTSTGAKSSVKDLMSKFNK